MRARRLIAAASVAALGLASLTACGNSAPDVAAYVGDTSWSTKRVDEIYDDLQAKYGEAMRQGTAQTGASPSPEELRSPVTRQDVLSLLVSLELGKRVAAAKNIQVRDEVSPEQLAQSLQAPPTAEYTRMWGEWVDVLSALNQQIPPADVSDDSLMAVYDAIVKVERIQPGLSVDEVRQAFGGGGFVGTASAVSAALEDESERAKVRINPRFLPLGVPSFVNSSQGIVFYSLPYIDQDGPVTDISTPESPAAEPTADEAAPGTES
ncbi:hypothetical protein ACFOOK_25865 [Micromonospora krabiensis]|uniref:SurA N-terminal domain-containing protein n=1 Tax=Micromonospora krabiensis TaxID=307121 RepID=A0A1C3N607_9ACTN|nr:hypothetical protein [Micromonospora krabiensis]SBV28007.1 hypothetical protein GA0070620_3539 [Micromonospora krabiensis]